MKKYLIFFIALAVIVVSCEIKTDADKVEIKVENKPKNIILLIGDGMGITQIYAAMTVAEKPLAMESFKVLGYHKTFSNNDYVTDSGAGGTALATGQKTNNKHISVDPEGNAFKTILEYAEENGLSTGLVSTSSITHATPASFIAHDTSRYNYENLAHDFLDVDIDLFIGGGKKHFNEREDSLNLIDSLKLKGYSILDKLNAFNPETESKIAVFTASGHNPEYREGRGDMLPLSTQKAANYLNKNKKGFFLMVEGSQIDWGGHDNDIEYVTSEVIDFDNAVAEALKFAKQDGETLVIVTADHETGGLTLLDGDFDNKLVDANFSTEHHSGVMVPVFAYGPGASEFAGIYDNTDVFKKMMKLYGFNQ